MLSYFQRQARTSRRRSPAIAPVWLTASIGACRFIQTSKLISMREPQLAGTRVRPPLIVEASGSRSLVHALGSTVVRLARVGARRTCLAVGPAYATSTTEVCAEMYRYYAPAIVLVDAGAEAATDGQLSRLGSVSALCAASVDTGQGTSTTGPAPVVATNTAGGWLDDAAAAKVPSGWGRGAANKKGGRDGLIPRTLEMACVSTRAIHSTRRSPSKSTT